MITVIGGKDIWETGCGTIAVPVNCVGVMGKGMALGFKKRHPGIADEYAGMCGDGQVGIGRLFFFRGYAYGSERNFLLFPTKKHWSNPSKMEWVEKGLDTFADWDSSVESANRDRGLDRLVNDRNEVMGAAEFFGSIAFPALGAGLGGLDRGEVLGKMVEKLHHLDMPIEIYWQ